MSVVERGASLGGWEGRHSKTGLQGKRVRPQDEEGTEFRAGQFMSTFPTWSSESSWS